MPYQPEHDEEERWNEPPIGPEWAGPIAPTYFNTRKVSIYGGNQRDPEEHPRKRSSGCDKGMFMEPSKPWPSPRQPKREGPGSREGEGGRY